MMDEVGAMIKLALAEFEKEFGEGSKFEEGDEFVTVFNDAVLILSLDGGRCGVKVIAGKPYTVNYTTGLVEEVEVR